MVIEDIRTKYTWIVECRPVQKLDFLDVTIILYGNGKIETDIHYKPSNSHRYLNYNSFHPTHCKDNIPFNLAKRIIMLVTNSDKMELQLRELALAMREGCARKSQEA